MQKISPEAAKRIREKENAARKKAIEQKAAAKRALSRQKGGALARRLRAEDVQKQKTAQDKQLAAKRMAAAKAAYNVSLSESPKWPKRPLHPLLEMCGRRCGRRR